MLSGSPAGGAVQLDGDGTGATGPLWIPVTTHGRRVRDVLKVEIKGVVPTVCSRSSFVITTGGERVSCAASKQRRTEQYRAETSPRTDVASYARALKKKTRCARRPLVASLSR